MTGYVDFSLLKRPASPNTALIAPPGFSLGEAQADAAAPIFDVEPEELFTRALRLINARRDWRLVDQDKAQMKLKFIAVTALLRFKDDIDVQIVGVPPGKSSYAAYSRSRVGYSDLGANRKRLDAFGAALQTP